MTSPKPTADLSAIYRLEFYKKINRWKLKGDRKDELKKKPKNLPKENIQTSKRLSLNETYFINKPQDSKSEPQSPETDSANVAFLEPEEEPTISSHNEKLCQQWLEPVDIWPAAVLKATENVDSAIEVGASNKKDEEHHIKKPGIQKRLEVLLKAAMEQDEPKSECALDIGEENIPESCEFNAEEMNNSLDNDLPRPELQQTFWSDPGRNCVEDLYIDHDVPDGLNNLKQGGDWKSMLNNLLALICPETVDGDSSSEFLSGAHAAPHSSETNVSLPAEFKPGNWSTNQLCNLTTRQLFLLEFDLRIKLILVLKDIEKRQTNRPVPSEFSSIDEFPTRDVGLYPVNEFLAGSHRAPHNVFGRGRGRILPERQRY